MVQSHVQAHVRAEWCYRLLSCPGFAAAAEQLGAVLAAEQLELEQPPAEGAATWQLNAEAAAISSSRSATKMPQSAAADKGPHIL